MLVNLGTPDLPFLHNLWEGKWVPGADKAPVPALHTSSTLCSCLSRAVQLCDADFKRTFLRAFLNESEYLWKISVIRIYGRSENCSVIRDPWLPVFDIVVGRRNNNSALQQLSWVPDLFVFQTKIKARLFFFKTVMWNYLGFFRSKIQSLLWVEVSLACTYQNFNIWQGTVPAHGHPGCSGSHGMVAFLDCKSHSLLEPIWATILAQME